MISPAADKASYWTNRGSGEFTSDESDSDEQSKKEIIEAKPTVEDLPIVGENRTDDRVEYASLSSEEEETEDSSDEVLVEVKEEPAEEVLIEVKEEPKMKLNEEKIAVVDEYASSADVLDIPLAHVRLFRREAISIMTKKDFWDLLAFLDLSLQSKLVDMWYLDENRAKDYIFKITTFSGNCHSMEKLMNLLKRTDELRIVTQLMLENLKTVKYYWRLFEGKDGRGSCTMDRLAVVLEPQVIVDFLRAKDCYEYNQMLNRVQALMDNFQVEDAACELLRSLPYCSDGESSNRRLGEWYYDFLEACLWFESTKMLPALIDADYAADLRYYRSSVALELEKALGELVIESDEKPSEPRNQADYQDFVVVSSNCLFRPAKYQLRPYQKELVEQANKGRNTIICAPTGCGKTLVATDIMLNHLRGKRQEGKIARALMLVPTVPLVDQQTIELMKYMSGEFQVDGFSGAETLQSRAGSFLASHVCVVTPQLIVNMLTSNYKCERIYFSDITMMMFDECHHCNKQHPYKVLMDMLEEIELEKRPQVVGLTASFGVGSTNANVEDCKEHMLKMCSFMTADCISTVRHQMDNLKSHVMPPVDSVLRARRPTNDKFADLIKDTMTKFERRISPVLHKLLDLQTISLTKEDITFRDHRSTSKCQAMIGNLRQLLKKLGDPVCGIWLRRSVDHLKYYFRALCISDLLPYEYGLKYLDEKMATYFHADNPEDVNTFLLETYKSVRVSLQELAANEAVEDKEILQKLYEIIREQYVEAPDSRTIIFVSTRACAQSLSEHLSDYLKKSKKLAQFYGKSNQAGYITSTNKCTSDGGQTDNLQKSMRTNFQNGDIKILVATSVADEGLNIAECNLIIKYNNVGSERTLIQRRGRARQMNSRAILLALDNGIEQQEYDNMRKEALMMDCMNDLQTHEEEALRKLILEKSAVMEKQRKEKHQNLLQQRKVLDPNSNN